jgi:predicted ATPase/transcriptional regulator with XRE-family HTH domain
MKRLRAAHDLTQEQLAEQIGCAAQTVRMLETSRRRPSREMALRLADVLGVSPEQREAFLRAARTPPTAAPAVPAAVAPPSLTTRRVALPQPPNALIGRQEERAAIRHAFGDERSRLVTLVGPGGIGKTRLALQGAANLAEDAGLDAVWVALAPFESAQVVSAMAEAIGVALPGDERSAEHLLAALREREALIVLDNVEHLLDPDLALVAPGSRRLDNLVDLVTAILSEAPGVRLLVTSRERLRLPGEWVIELAGLSVPRQAQGAAVERAPATILFLERARQSDRNFALTRANREAVAQICRLLEGTPLAIELAAAWIRTLSPAEIAAEIARSLDFLSLAGRALPPQHRSLRAIFEQSWQLLGADKQRILARLAVFRGGWRRQAAEQVAGATLPILASLIDKSLVRTSQNAACPPRYELHELIRQYAAEKLAADPAMEYEAHQHHSMYYAALLQEALPRLESSDQAATLREMDAELGNLRLAWEWAIAQHDFAALRAMGWSMWIVYEMRSRVQEVAALFHQATEALRAVGTGLVMAPELRQILGVMLTWHGWAFSRSGEVTAASELLREGAALLAEDERELAMMGTLGFLGMTLRQLGRFAEARAVVERNLALLRPRGVSFMLAMNTIYLGHIAQAQGSDIEARALAAEARALTEATGSLLGQVSSLALGASIANEQGEPDAAEALARKALELSALHQDRWGVAAALQQLGLVALARGDIAEGRYLLVESVELCEELGEHWLRGRALVALGAAERARGDQQAAQRAWLDTLRLARATGMAPIALSAIDGLAALADDAGAAERALALLAHVATHPATEHVVRARAIELHAALAALIAPSCTAVLDRTQSLDALVDELLQVAG